MQVEFREAVVSVKKLSRRPVEEELLKLYGLFKQGMVGDVNVGTGATCTLRPPTHILP